MTDPISEIDDSNLEKSQAIKAQEALDKKQEQQPDTSLTMTLQLLDSALKGLAEELSKLKHHTGKSVSGVSAQTPADLFASSKPTGSGLGAAPPPPSGADDTGGAKGTGGANNLLGGIGGPDPTTQGSDSGPPTKIADWKAQLKAMVAAMEKMPAGAAINFITQKLLPFLGSYKQWQMSQEGVTMNTITEINKDVNLLKKYYNECQNNKWPDDGSKQIGALIEDIHNLAQSKSVVAALGDSGTAGFKAVMDTLTDNQYSVCSTKDAQGNLEYPDRDKVVEAWQKDWDNRSGGSGSSPTTGVNPDSTILDGFSQSTTMLNNQSSGAQGEFKQDNSDYNTYNQILTQTLKDLTSQYNYFNQKMTGN